MNGGASTTFDSRGQVPPSHRVRALMARLSARSRGGWRRIARDRVVQANDLLVSRSPIARTQFPIVTISGCRRWHADHGCRRENASGVFGIAARLADRGRPHEPYDIPVRPAETRFWTMSSATMMHAEDVEVVRDAAGQLPEGSLLWL